MTEQVGRSWSGWRVAGWSFAVLLLLLPAVAMRFTDEMRWDKTDFLVMGALIGGTGLGIEFLVRKSGGLAYRLGSALALVAAFLTVWINLAVGMIGSEDNPYNLLFGAVLAVAFGGSIVARFRPAGMAIAMAATGLAQVLIGAAGLSADGRGGVLSIVFAALWFLAATLFGTAARERRVGGERFRSVD